MLESELEVSNNFVEDFLSVHTLTIESRIIWLKISLGPRNITISLDHAASLVSSPETGNTLIVVVDFPRNILTVLSHTFKHEVDTAQPSE